MTCIVAIKNKKKVQIWGDSAGVSGLDVRIRKDKKVFTMGEFGIGYSSSFRMGQLIRFKLKIPNPPKKTDLFLFMATVFIEELRVVLSKGGYTKIELNSEDGGCFIVGIRGRIFTIYDDFQVSEDKEEFMSVGCGEKYALGALEAMRKTIRTSPHNKAKIALETAEKFSGGVRRPFNFVEV
jgi:ATP-dependent protease HslVU (ClpYQ) peptidase subunit